MSTSRDNVITELRAKLERNWDLLLELASETRSDETCLGGGLAAFGDAIHYGSIFASFRKGEPFLRPAFENLTKALNGAWRRNEADSQEAHASQTSNAHFGLFASRELINGREHPTDLSDLEEAVGAISAVLTEARIAAVGVEAPNLASDEASDWARYVARYLGLHVLCRLFGKSIGPVDAKRIEDLVTTVRSRELKGLVLVLSRMAVENGVSEPDWSIFNKEYTKHINWGNYNHAIIDGFVLSQSYIFSIIRSKGKFRDAMVNMLE